MLTRIGGLILARLEDQCLRGLEGWYLRDWRISAYEDWRIDTCAIGGGLILDCLIGGLILDRDWTIDTY